MAINEIGNRTMWPGNISRKETPDRRIDKSFTGSIEEAENTGAARVSYAEQAFNSVGKNAPQEVRDAWMEAAREAGVDGLGMKKNGMLSHISQLMVERVERSMRGQDSDDILGSTVESARRAIENALYDLEHPLAGERHSADIQEWIEKERQFYKAFLAKLPDGNAEGRNAVLEAYRAQAVSVSRRGLQESAALAEG